MVIQRTPDFHLLHKVRGLIYIYIYNIHVKNMNKHDTGNCEFCGQEETFEHIMLECGK